jgi:serine/threonine protein kinase, bacterial
MGVVWRGQDLETGAWVAIKLLRPDYAASPAAVSRFVGERNALIRFRHPNVVNLRDMIVEGDRLALVMDLITGGDLDTFRQHSGGTLAPPVAVRLTAQICDGLAAAHAAGIIHRDLKPSNVLLQAGQVKLADFGISRITGEARHTTTGTVMGTPTYLAPEAINGAEPTNAADVYAAGITLYELLTGEPPFDGHVVAVMQAHLQREPERIPGISDPLWELVAACLSKDPAGRPAADGLARSLKALQENTGADALGPGPARSGQPAPPSRTMPQLSQQTAGQPARPAQTAGLASQSPQPGRSPVPRQSPAPAQSPAPVPAAQFQVPAMLPGQQPVVSRSGPLATPPPGDGRRKRLLAGLAALVVVIAVAATVYATSFSSNSTATLTRGGLTAPTIGAGTTIGQPTPSHPGKRRGHPGGRAGDPTPTRSASSPNPSHTSGRGKGKPTGPASKPASSPATSPTTDPPTSPTQTSVPYGSWDCGPKTAVPLASGLPSGKTLTACIRISGTKMQVQGTLTGAAVGSDRILLAFESPEGGLVTTFESALCAAATCVFTQATPAIAGYSYFAKPSWYEGGVLESTGSPSPTMAYNV